MMLVPARTAIAIAAAEGTASAACAGLAGTRLVDGQVATLKVLAPEGIDGGLAFLGIAHRDEAESA